MINLPQFLVLTAVCIGFILFFCRQPKPQIVRHYERHATVSVKCLWSDDDKVPSLEDNLVQKTDHVTRFISESQPKLQLQYVPLKADVRKLQWDTLSHYLAVVSFISSKTRDGQIQFSIIGSIRQRERVVSELSYDFFCADRTEQIWKLAEVAWGIAVAIATQEKINLPKEMPKQARISHKL